MGSHDEMVNPGSSTENRVLSQDKNCRLLSCVNNKAMEFGCWDLNFVVEIGKQERLNFPGKSEQNDSMKVGKSSQLGKHGFSSLDNLT